MWSVLLTIIISALGLILYRMHRARYAFADKWPNTQPYYPLVGNAPMLVGLNDVEQFEAIRSASSKNDRIMKVWAGPKLYLLTSHPDLVQQILSSPACLEKPFVYRFFGFEEGLFTAKYHTWKIARKQLNPSFNIRSIHGFIPIFARCGQKLVANLNEFADGETVNIHKFTTLCALEMACGTTLGSDVLQREGKEEFKEGLEQVFHGAAKRVMSLYLYPDFVYRKTVYHTELMKARKTVCDFLTKLVLEREQLFTEQRDNIEDGKNKNNEDDCEGEDYNKPKIFLDYLLTSTSDGKRFTQKQITDHIYTIISGAVDTTGLVTAHACLCLCFYPEVQDRLYEEINKYFPISTGSTDVVEFSVETLMQLTYTEMFMNEVLRLWTVAPLLVRKNMAEIELDGVKVPPGNDFTIDVYNMHRRQDFWGPDADRFDPDRFSEERLTSRQLSAFKPFSVGSRMCIGYRYASFSFKVMMVNLVRNFKLSSKIKPEDIRFKFDLTLKLPFDHLVQIHKRHPRNE